MSLLFILGYLKIIIVQSEQLEKNTVDQDGYIHACRSKREKKRKKQIKEGKLLTLSSTSIQAHDVTGGDHQQSNATLHARTASAAQNGV